MNSRRLWFWGAVAMGLLIGDAGRPAVAADGATPSVSPGVHPRVHPIFAQLPDAPFNDLARAAFGRAVDRSRLRPLETIHIDVPAAPPLAPALKLAKDNVRKLDFAAAARPLNEMVDALAGNGGAGLSTDELSDLYLFAAMTTAHADWKPARSVDATTQARAYVDYLRAVTLTPTRALNPRETPPQTMDDWARALAEVRARPHGTLVVRGSASATVSFDGNNALPVRGAATFADVVYGEHLIRVEEVGYPPWGAVVTVDRPEVAVTVPARATLVLDDRVAGAHARRMDAEFALVAEVKIGAPELLLELRLVDATGIRHDASVVPLGGAERGAIDAAVMHLDEEARRIEKLGLAPSLASDSSNPAGPPSAAEPLPASNTTVVLTPAPRPAAPRAAFKDDPAAWARQNWPLLTVVGITVGTIIVGVAAGR
jgi:hypothetical protein